MGGAVLYIYRGEEKKISDDLVDAVCYCHHSQMYIGQRLFLRPVDMFIYANLLFLFIVQLPSIEINDFLNSQMVFSSNFKATVEDDP